MLTPQFLLPIADEMVVDIFAGGGGMSTAIEQAIGRHSDIAINHDDDALSMHRVNHPQTRHFVADVFEVDPRGAAQGRPVGLLHLSPDCTHHSQAAGGQPRDRKIRALSWVGLRWAGQVHPRVITLENVGQIRKWGPLVAKRDRATGRVLKLDGTIAEPGERVPVQQQYLIPDAKRAGRTWQRFLALLRAEGYAVEHRILCAADYGAPTTRERLFLVARRDGLPIRWPEPTHHRKPAKGQQRWRAAAECIDWSIECPSIFARKRPLADATLRRIARGVQRFVIDAAEPFIVPIANWSREAVQPVSEPLRTVTAYPKGGSFAIVAPTLAPVTHQGGDRAYDPSAPLPTVTAAHRGEIALAAATLVQTGYGERDGQAPRSLDLENPLGTIVAGGQKHALVSAFLAQMNGGFNDERGTPGHDLRRPVSTINTKAANQQLVECTLSPEVEAGALRVAAFLTTYYGNGAELDPRDPMATITTRDRLALVTVLIRGTPYVIVDIGLRMLQPSELYAAQGFPREYVIDHGHDGRRFTKTAQVRMVGNSVSPPPAAALVRANWLAVDAGRAAA